MNWLIGLMLTALYIVVGLAACKAFSFFWVRNPLGTYRSDLVMEDRYDVVMMTASWPLAVPSILVILLCSNLGRLMASACPVSLSSRSELLVKWLLSQS